MPVSPNRVAEWINVLGWLFKGGDRPEWPGLTETQDVETLADFLTTYDRRGFLCIGNFSPVCDDGSLELGIFA